MIDCSKIKLVIWDLDDTFWTGTLSEGPITPIAKNIQLIKHLTDRGIVNTICSKNDFEPTDKKLQELGIADFFVFKSIDWTPKGQRISKLIKDMGLRPVNCLFLDDNIVNLNEALFYSKDLMTSEPEGIEELTNFCSEAQITDVKHKRLLQYKVLEEKQRAKTEAGDNLSFLYSSNTQVELHYDCLEIADRIYELIHRTNQLNFTKYRCTREELDVLFSDPTANCGYVTVKDNFGDYGIVGFFAIKNNICLHFLFSCRTIGQGVEQWVYSTLGWPILKTEGEVVNNVERIPAPDWINMSGTSSAESKVLNTSKIVFKGPCDLDILSSFLDSTNIIREFTYVGNSLHNSIEHHNHSLNYLNFPLLSEDEKDKFVERCIFNDSDMFHTNMYDNDVSLLFLSTLIEANLGVYKRKCDGFRFAFGEWRYPLTDKQNWDGFFNGSLVTYGNKFTHDWLKHFNEEYTFEGRIKPEEVVSNVTKVLEKVSPNAKICLILGSETSYINNKSESYKDREVYHIRLNNLLRTFAKGNERVFLLDFNEFIHSQDDFLNNINHFQRRVYFEASKTANTFIEKATGSKVKERGKIALLKSNVKAFIIESLKKQPKLMAFIVRIVRNIKTQK